MRPSRSEPAPDPVTPTGDVRPPVPAEPAVAPTRSTPAGASRGRWAFLGIAFALSWSVWGLSLLVADPELASLVRAVGTFGPSTAALLVVAGSTGRAGVRALLRRLTTGREAGTSVLLAALAPVVVVVTALGVHRALGGTVGPLGWASPWVPVVAVIYVLVLGGPLGEELGWRGYALDALERRLAPLGASLAIGVAWTLWHLPLFFIDGTVQHDLPIALFAWQIMATSILYTWLVHRAHGSLLPALVLHTSFNATLGLLPVLPDQAGSSRPVIIALVLATVIAVVVARTGTFRTPPGPARKPPGPGPSAGR